MSDRPPSVADGLACPVPLSSPATVQRGHGGGGRMTKDLVERVFLAGADAAALRALHDGAVLDVPAGRLAISTDAFVVTPLFFPGGDIGSLAVHGTVNDLAMCGARPVALSAAFVLEEGFPIDDLARVAASMRAAAAAVGVPVVTGDTKVVDRGRGDGVYVVTTGVGVVREGVRVDPRRAAPGDRVLVSGDLGVHGVVVLSVREGLRFETDLVSDSAPLHDLVAGVLDAAGDRVHVLRDPTRGGLASALVEIAESAGVAVALDERALPVPEPVRGACEILGLDPLAVANEGKCVAVVAPGAADSVLAAMRAHPLGRRAAIVGEVVAGPAGRVTVGGRAGGARLLEMPRGEQLPRIC